MVVACFVGLPTGCLSSPLDDEGELALELREAGPGRQSQSQSQSQSPIESKRCGNGQINPGEECDHGLANADDGACTTACRLAVCGDGLLHVGVEECDDGGPRCSESCTRQPCTWDWDPEVLTFPVEVRPGQAALGEITFDSQCNLLVSGGEELPYVDGIYRVDKDDGSISVAVAVADLPEDAFFLPAMTYRESDRRVYFFVGDPPSLFALDEHDQVHELLVLDKPLNSLTVAPAGFGDYEDQLIAISYPPAQLLAIDVDSEEKTISEIGDPWDNSLSVATFAPDGSLYVAEYGKGQISTVTAEGDVTPVFWGFRYPDGLGFSSDGSLMVVAHRPLDGVIDVIATSDGTLLSSHPFEIAGGFAPTGLVVDGANHVLYEMCVDEAYSVVQVFEAP